MSLARLPGTYFSDPHLCARDITHYCIQPLVELRQPGVYVTKRLSVTPFTSEPNKHIIAINGDGRFIIADCIRGHLTSAGCCALDITTGERTIFPLIFTTGALIVGGRPDRIMLYDATGVTRYSLAGATPCLDATPTVHDRVGVAFDDEGYLVTRFTSTHGQTVDIYGRFIACGNVGRGLIYISAIVGVDHIVHLMDMTTGEILRKQAINTEGMPVSDAINLNPTVFQCGKHIVLVYQQTAGTSWTVYVFNQHGRKRCKRTIISNGAGNAKRHILTHPNEPKFAIVSSSYQAVADVDQRYTTVIDLYEIEELIMPTYI